MPRFAFLLPLIPLCSGCSDRAAVARAQVEQWVEKLDGQTAPSGAYKRFDGDRLPEVDPWGNKLYVQYEQGGVNEVVKVRSSGRDGKPFTDDDIVDSRMSANLTGLGEGIKSSAEDVAEGVARGVVKGAIEGVKEGFKRNRKPGAGVEKDVQE